MSERPPISPRSPRAALEPEQVPPPPKRSDRARNPLVIAGNAIITNPSRTLVNQAPWVVNLALNYENESGTNGRILYNVNGRTLVRAGTEGLPDSYDQSVHSLDFAISQRFLKHFSVRFQVQDILSSKRTTTMGKKPEDINDDGTPDNIVREFRNGTTFGVGLAYEL